MTYKEIPKYRGEICEKYVDDVYAGNPPAKALMEKCMGEFGICIDNGNTSDK